MTDTTPPSLAAADPLDRVAVALDTADRDELDRWARELGPRVGCLKLGLEAFVRWGPPVVESVRAHARQLFLDLKLHDIPNTVAGAVGSAAELGVDLITVHAGGGRAMMEAAAQAAGDRVTILGVTLLTHLDRSALDALDLAGAADDRVSRWADLARAAGCGGVVSSPLEAERLRAELPRPFLLVTPGIRPAAESPGDQRRVATPREAVGSGADLLVIGRPITRASDPHEALDRIAAELATA